MLRDWKSDHRQIGWDLIDGDVWRRPTCRLHPKSDYRRSGSEQRQPRPARSGRHSAKVRADRGEPLSYGKGKTTTLRIGGNRRMAHGGRPFRPSSLVSRRSTESIIPACEIRLTLHERRPWGSRIVSGMMHTSTTLQ